jgi:hypothetical protein
MAQWLQWQEVVGGSTTYSTIGAASYMNSVYLFAIGVHPVGEGSIGDDYSLSMRCIRPATPWAPELDSGWALFPVGGATDVGVGTAVFNSKLSIFGRGVDGHKIYVSTTADGTKWSKWSAFPVGGTTSSGITAVVYNSRLYVFARGETGNKIWVSSTMDGTQWTSWSSPFPILNLLPAHPELDTKGLHLYQVGLSVAPAVHEGRLYLFALDNEWKIFVCSTTDGTKWSSWVPVGGIAGGPVGAVSFSGGLHVFSTGHDLAQIWMKGSPDGVTWNDPWTKIGTPDGGTVGPPTVIGGGSAITLYLCGRYGAIWSRRAHVEVDHPLDY